MFFQADLLVTNGVAVDSIVTTFLIPYSLFDN